MFLKCHPAPRRVSPGCHAYTFVAFKTLKRLAYRAVVLNAAMLLAAPAPYASAQEHEPVQNENPERLRQQIEALIDTAGDRPVPVIVRLDLDDATGASAFRPEGTLNAPSVLTQRSRISQVRDRLLQRLGAGGVSNVKSYRTVPLVAMTLDRAALRGLASDSDVLEIFEDKAMPATLDSSLPVMDIDSAHAQGYTGLGQTVAILDTGVDNDHAFFGGRVVSEACYSTTNSFSTSVCPGGVAESTAPESGENCTVGGCAHGTHVAGIAAGDGGSMVGVAPDADIIAIQVFSRFDDPGICFPSPAPCVLSYTSDQIKGLERVLELSDPLLSMNIAAANMSLGGSLFASHCDSEPHKPAIDNLFSVDIATTIASGNNGSDGSISTPACISTAVAVGSSFAQDTETAAVIDASADVVSSFSNHADLVDLMAVGTDVTSSIPGGGFASFNGTSMAAPHVAGTWALMKEAGGASTVGEVEDCLENTGVGVARAGITVPRIDADIAIGCAVANAAPGNDQFIKAFRLSGSAGLATGNNDNATGDPGEPDHAGSSGVLNSVWWTWTPTQSGTIAIDTQGSNFDTTLGIYKGAATGAGALALTEVASNDDAAGSDTHSEVTFSAAAGTAYHIAVDGFANDMGDIKLSYELNAVASAVTPDSAPRRRSYTDGRAGETARALEDISTSGENYPKVKEAPSTDSVEGETETSATTSVDSEGDMRLAPVDAGEGSDIPAASLGPSGLSFSRKPDAEDKSGPGAN